MRILAVLVAVVVAAGSASAVQAADPSPGATATPDAAAGPERPARARAEAAIVTGTLRDAGRISTRDGRRVAAGRLALGWVTATDSRATVAASTNDGAGAAEAVTTVRSVALFDGLVRAERVRRTASAADGETTYSGEVEGLQIGEQAIGTVAEEASYDLPDGAGVVTVNRGREGLLVQLAQAVDRWPAGTVVAVGTAHATASDAVTTSTPTPTPTPTPSPTPTTTPEAAPREPSKGERRRAARRAERRRIARETARLADGDFTFPVAGTAQFADDFGGARQIGPHQGNDIFAPFGTPVVAVADGRVEKVGTLPISGNRLWVRTDEGDTFFYAHLASFAPAARSGSRVSAGTVLGYVGNTGDAEPTPPHLHFEAHPGDGDAIDPYAVLTAWHERAGAEAADTAARPGALLEVRDLID